MSDLFEPIAIVGIAARLPGASDVHEYWANLAGGRESITALTDAELLRAGVPASRIADPSYVKMAGLVPGVDTFDPAFFRMTKREAEVCDPQLRLFLEVTYQAVENAGYDPATMSRDVAVYGACGPSRYGDVQVLANPKYAAAPDMGLTVLNNIDYLTTLVSYKLDFRGPSMAVLTACSSSLTAVHLACQSLQLGECDLAVAGGSNVEIPYQVGYRWSPGDVRSADGHCRPFDASASGTIFTSGAGAVLLKRLDDAITDGDHIGAVIHGVGVNNDGSDKVSFSAPSVSGQALAITDAMAMAGFAPEDIGCVEMHATGTPLGDPIEIAALARAYRRLAAGPLAAGSIPVGSVKSNIGHTVPVAGIAGLLKLVLAMENEQIPPTINITRANPKLEIEETPFLLNRALRPWPRQAGKPRRAGLSSLGIGGTNVHLVLEEGPTPAPTPHLDRPRVVIWSGLDEAAAHASQATLAEYFAAAGETAFADATATLQRGRTAHPVRAAVVSSSARQAAGLLAGQGQAPISGLADDTPAGVIFTFPGQGSQHARMAASLYGSLRVFTETIDVCFDILGRLGADLYPLWLAQAPGSELHDTANAQPLLFAVEYALARQWIAWGIRPAALLGHSLGELVAATVAGVMDLDDALRLVLVRGQVMQAQPGGSMLAAAGPVERLRTLLPADATAVVMAAVNTPDQAVLAGPTGELAEAAQVLGAAGIVTRPLRTSHAFHTPAMRPAAEAFLASFAGMALRPPALPVYSAATGKLLTGEQATSPAFWAGQLTDPVLFSSAVEAVTEVSGGRFLLEVGPGRALTRLALRHPAVRAAQWRALPSLSWPDDRDGPSSDVQDMLETLARLWVRGVDVEWSRVYPDEPLQRVPLPGYQWQRSRYWVEAVTGPAAPQSSATSTSFSGTDPASSPTVTGPAAPAPSGAGPFTMTAWTEAERPEPPAADSRPPAGVALALLPAGPAAPPLASALEEAGHLVFRLRPGSGFEDLGHEFTVRPACLEQDLDRVLARLSALGHEPTTLVHGWAAGTPEESGDAAATAEQLDRTFFALLDLVQRAGRRPVAGRLPSVLVLTRGAADVSGNETITPSRAALVAATRAFGMESAGTSCRVIDLGSVISASELAAELSSGASDPVVALRGTRRWLPGQKPWSPRSGGRPGIRPDGVYLLTGGLGGLGLEVAKGLAATGRRPRLALVGRRPRDVAADLAGLESMGASVRVITCDVADPAALTAALDDVTAAFGPVNGVLHLAGIAGDGMLQFRRREQAHQVLRPKVFGTLALAQALAGRPPVDFVACFSSQAALTGMVGGADYSAANAFLDAFAASRPGWLSIDWPGWSTVGMASDGVLDRVAAAMRAATAADPADPGPADIAPPGGPSAEPAGPYLETVLSAATHWMLDEHRIGDAAVLPGTALIDLIISAYLRTIPAAAAPVTLRDIVFLRPLIGDEPVRTRVCFEPAGERAWAVQVLSGPDGAADGWQLHARCLLTSADPAAPAVMPDDLTTGLTELPPPSLLPSRTTAFAFGPRWRNVERMWESGTTMVVSLALPEPFAPEVADHAVHPALLDTATGLLRRATSGDLFVPFLYESLTWYAPLPARLRARMRVRPGDHPAADGELVAPDGTVLLSVTGVQLRPATLAGLGAAQPPSATRPGPGSGSGSGSGAGAGDGDAPAAHARPTAAGLAPDVGVRLLLELLESATPAQVAVAAHGADVRVPAPAAPRTSPPERDARPADTMVNASTAGQATASGDRVHDTLATLWRNVLGRDSVAPDDDFFELGGDSLTAVALTGRIRDTFEVEMSIGLLFEYPTLALLTGALREQGAR